MGFFGFLFLFTTRSWISFNSQKYYLMIPCGFATFSFTARGKHLNIEANGSHSVFLFPRFALGELLHWRVINHYLGDGTRVAGITHRSKIVCGCPDEWAVSEGAVVVSVLFSCHEFCLPMTSSQVLVDSFQVTGETAPTSAITVIDSCFAEKVFKG